MDQQSGAKFEVAWIMPADEVSLTCIMQEMFTSFFKIKFRFHLIYFVVLNINFKTAYCEDANLSVFVGL